MKNAFGILLSGFMVLLDTMQLRPKVVRDIVLMWVVLHNILRTHQGGVDRAHTPADDITSIGNQPVVYVPDENCRSNLREAKHQRDLLKDYFNHIGVLAGEEEKTEI